MNYDYDEERIPPRISPKVNEEKGNDNVAGAQLMCNTISTI